ncbi:MAG: lytic transglycosylase domain-containing protein [Bacteroidetes bacterium]|nr:lytic transglycosylase domain-containing protein [Bacteroidota bacterium]
MKRLVLCIILLSPLLYFAQEDRVLEVLDSLSSVYYYSKLEYEGGEFKGKILKSTEAELKERFGELSKNSPFPFEYNSIVNKYVSNYLNGYKNVSIILSNSNYYFPKFEEYLLKYQIPLELKYLSVIESALNPTAKSYCGAAGLWQFMPQTGKAYNLKINSYIDERYSVDLATAAACRYLKDLYSIYGDWALAIAGYNCGAGNVNKAIKRAGGKRSFFEIMQYLPKETQGYVPAFMAASYVMSFHKEHQIPILKTKLAPKDFEIVEVTKKTSIELLAKEKRVGVKELKYYNPSFYIGIVPGNNDKVFVPVFNSVSTSNSQTVANTKNPKSEKEKVETQKSVFGTTRGTSQNVNASKNSLPQKEESDVIICEVINDFDYKVGEEIKVRSLSSISSSIPRNSVLIGKVVLKDGHQKFNFQKVLNTQESINYFTDFAPKIFEGETVYLK